jgi:hypothetical protein
MGCQTIIRYLETLPEGVNVGGAVFVAGFLKKLSGLEDDEVVRSVSAEWLESPINLQKVKIHLNKSVAIFSDDDPYVPMENQEEFKDILGSKIIVEHKMRHFSGSSGTKKLPIALNSLLEISK